VSAFQTMQGIVMSSVGHAGFQTTLVCCLLELQALLAGLGSMDRLLFHVTTNNEIGIRMASEHSVHHRSLVFGQALSPSARGLLGGVVSVLGLRRVLSSFLSE